jgi:BMFP domain-containing protein YqiC
MEQVLCENRDRLNFLERKIAHLEFALKGLKEDQHKP